MNPGGAAAGRSGIKVAGLSHTFGAGDSAVHTLDGVDLAVAPGEFATIIGPSGCGKSTLLRVLAGLLAPSSGIAEVGGVSALERHGLAAFMPQRDLLLPWRRVLGNAVLGAEVAGVDRATARLRAQELLPAFGLAGFERAWPSQLSGGMRQRLALLRTFLQPADVLLLDEPFGALDAITRRGMQAWLQDVWSRDRRTVLLVTHDVDEAMFLSDSIYVMSSRPGRLGPRTEVGFGRPRGGAHLASPAAAALRATLLEGLVGDAPVT